MGTQLSNTDVIPLTSRPTLTVMDDGDYFAILDTSTGKISKILRADVQKALNISYDNTTSGLTATQVQAALDELVVDLGSSDNAISALAGRLDILEGADTVVGSVAKSIKDNAGDATFTPTVGSGIASTSIEEAVNEVGVDVEGLKTSKLAVSSKASIAEVTVGTDNDKYLTSASLKTSVPTLNGIKFPATAVPSADPNTLDDYEEGSWTPVLTRASTPSEHTYTRQLGRYTKIGNSVTVYFEVLTSALTTSGEGQNRISGLPFTPSSDQTFYGSGNLIYSSLMTTLAGIVAEYTKGYLYFVGTNVNTSTISTEWNNSGYMIGTITYLV